MTRGACEVPCGNPKISGDNPGDKLWATGPGIRNGRHYDDHVTTSAATSEEIMDVLRGVIDPELGSDIVELGMAKGATIAADGTAHIKIALTTMGCPLRAQIRNDIRDKVEPLPGITKVKIDWTELTQAEKAATMARARRNVAENPPDTAISDDARVLMVASGKGGVGKSSITTNLAAAIASMGFTVGVLDADIWGYSVPRMLGVDGRLQGHQPETPESAETTQTTGSDANTDGKTADSDASTDGAADSDEATAPPRARILPNEKVVDTGLLKIVSMGFLVDQEETALMWRGLMLNRAVQHFLEDVQWGYLDYLLIDMPPGTGDVQMGLAKMLPRAEMLLVTTPAQAAQKVAARAASMGRNNYLRIVGVILIWRSCSESRCWPRFRSMRLLPQAATLVNQPRSRPDRPPRPCVSSPSASSSTRHRRST